jgi:hypothetical protein
MWTALSVGSGGRIPSVPRKPAPLSGADSSLCRPAQPKKAGTGKDDPNAQRGSGWAAWYCLGLTGRGVLIFDLI